MDHRRADAPICRLAYTSRSTAPVDELVLREILLRSQANNAIDGVTGLLWCDGHQFFQILEGWKDSVDATMGRIRNDLRHHELRVLIDEDDCRRLFPDWAMALIRASGTPPAVVRALRDYQPQTPEQRAVIDRVLALG